MVSFKMDKQLLRVHEAAAVLNVSRWTVYRWVEAGRLEGTRIGKQSLRVTGNSVDRLISENRTDHRASGR
jgi:excisionase family DNA binding protein